MATIPANNNTGLYNTTGTAATTGNDITVNGNVNANNFNATSQVNAGTNITAQGNITGAYIIGNGSLLTNINAANVVGGYGNANVAAYLASGTNTSNVITTGNVSGTYILGNGSQLTGLPATYGNANVNAHLAAFGSNTISTTGNITGGYLFGNGSQLTGIGSSYGNANVAAFLPTYTGNLAGGNAAITNDLVVGGTIFGTFSGNISGNIVVPGSNTQVLFNNNGNAGASADFTFNDATNLLSVAGNVTAGNISATGNIDGSNVNVGPYTKIGPGSITIQTLLTNGTITADIIDGLYGSFYNLNANGNVTVGGSLNSDDITSTGNVTVNGNQVITGNLTVQGTTTTINSNTITTNDKTITVANNQSTGANVDGAGLEAGNPAVATWLYNNASDTWKSSIGISAVGNITGANILSSTFQAVNSGGGALKNASGTTQAAWGAGGGDNFAINVSTNLNGNNAQIAISPTGTGHVHIKPTGTGSLEIAPTNTGSMNNVIIGNVTPAAANVTTLGTSGNITTAGILTDNYRYANGTPVTFGGTYGNANVATYLASGTVVSDIVTSANVTGGNVTTVGLVSATGNITGGNLTAVGQVVAGGNLTATGVIVTNANLILNNSNITYQNGAAKIRAATLEIVSTADISGNTATGGILTDNYYYANGTPIPFGYGNPNVVSLLAAFGSNTISTTGNVTVGNLVAPVTLGAGGIYGRILTANQSNITSLGTLVQLNVSGNIDNASNFNGGNAYVNYIESAGNIDGVNLNLSGGIYLTASNFDIGSGTFIGGNANISGNVRGGNLTTTGQVVANGNIAGNYILGNGSALTGITTTLAGAMTGDITGGNTHSLLFINNLAMTGAISNPAGDTVVIEGITTSGVINSTGNITTTANISGAYILGNGSQLTGVSASLAGNLAGNINTGPYYIQNTGGDVLMGNVWVQGTLAANTISSPGGDFVTIEGVNATNGVQTTANISAGYYIGNGSLLTGLTTSLAGNLAGNINTGSYYIQNIGGEVLMGNVWVQGTLAANTISAPAGDYVTIEGVAATNGLNSSGNINALNQQSVNFYETGNTNYLGLKAPSSVAADVVWTLPGTDGSSGQVLGTYGNGVMYWTTGGSAGAGGSNTQIQFNDGGTLAGNAAITFNKTNGNITLGTTVVNAQQIQTTANANVGLTSSLTPNPGRIFVGAGYNGNISPAFDINNGGRGGRLVVSDSINVSDGNTIVRGLVAQNFYTLTANVTSTNARLNGAYNSIAVGGGPGANTISGATSAITGGLNTVVIGGGTSGNLTGLGNTTAQYAISTAAFTTLNAGSIGGNMFGTLSQVINSGTANAVIAYTSNFIGTGTYNGNVIAYYSPGAVNNFGPASANTARNATNYYAFYNDDDVAQMKMGSVRLFHEFEYQLSSSGGAVTVNKNNGQVQFFTVSEAATMSFSNFVTSASTGSTTKYQTDTVTVIVQQDGTGRTITMPTPSATYKYAGGTSTVSSTASSISMISITAIYNSVTAATQYLITISPEFS